MQRAWKRVKANRGGAGVDGRDTARTGDWLKTAWPAIRAQLQAGSYQPAPVRRVAIPKPNGGERTLGIPTVTDRLIQQALLQVLQPLIDPHFSDHSHGFRPGRSAHDAVRSAQAHVEAGYRVVVDVDVKGFFDHVDHDLLMAKLAQYVSDPAVLRLVRAYLDAGVMADEAGASRREGTPQGGPLSPLLANVVLHEVDRTLEQRGLRFERYADDSNVYVRTKCAGHRVLAGLRKLYARLGLQLNETKTGVRSAFAVTFLGYAFQALAGGRVKLKVASKARAAFKRRVTQLTRRNSGRSMPTIVQRLAQYLRGWRAYFRLAQTPHQWVRLDQWIRRRLRAVQLAQWKRGPVIYRQSRRLGASHTLACKAAGGAGRWWRSSAQGIHYVLTIAYFDRLGVPRLC